ncbi:BQ5605_C022g09515 [Microbotryum silenes-dioicae]|uniref:BQ5605_C022g09515 protein n=1 Tax=Microbotryum silenes-dioicae TaxID=796604 RepID=A0A2X0NDK1_9BASI|nr:BQ5605_C022g09515 [Microbotryum silenes-dioicae]
MMSHAGTNKGGRLGDRPVDIHQLSSGRLPCDQLQGPVLRLCSGELIGVCLFGSFLALDIVALDVDHGDRAKRRIAKRTETDQAERSRLADDESATCTMRSDHLRPDRPKSQTSDIRIAVAPPTAYERSRHLEYVIFRA